MNAAPSAATASRLEKMAVDNGFDRELGIDGGWLGFASTQAPMRLWLTAVDDPGYLAAMSMAHVVAGLVEFGDPLAPPYPDGAIGGRVVGSFAELHHLVRRAFQLSRTLPDALLERFERDTAALPRTTEAERVVIQRVGQSLFRDGLIEYWEGRCAITGLSVVELLRASHIKPWAACASDAERLDVFNGLLLAAHLDAAFDAGFITAADDGQLIVSDVLSSHDRLILSLDSSSKVPLKNRHLPYLHYHRSFIFRSSERIQREPAPSPHV